MSLKTYRFCLYPTRKQAETLQWTLDRNREVYNAALQERRDAWAVCKQHPNYYDPAWRQEHVREYSVSCYDQIKQLPEIKEARQEYKEIHSQIVQDTLRRVDKAFKAFFRRVKSGEEPGYPRFQGKDRYDSFCYPQAGFGVEKRGDKKHVLMLSKIGPIKIKLHRPIQGAMKTCTIKRENERWSVCIACEVGTTQRTPYTDEAVGVDVGLYHLAALSSGDVIDNPRFYRQAEQKLAKIQRELARKKHRSHRRKKTVQRLSKASRKVRTQRQDFLHQWSRRLVNTYEAIVFEELAPSNMSKAPKPKQDEQTGAYVSNGAAVKAGLNKSIQDAGWSTFIAMCEYKAENAGTVQVKKVDPYKTSQVCSGCLHEGPHKDLSERVHICEACGLVLDRDVNAAKNILALWQEGLHLRPAPKEKQPKTKKNAQARTEPSEDAPLRSPWL